MALTSGTTLPKTQLSKNRAQLVLLKKLEFRHQTASGIVGKPPQRYEPKQTQ